MRARYPIGPKEVSGGSGTLGVVDEVRQVDHGTSPRQKATESGRERSQRHTEVML